MVQGGRRKDLPGIKYKLTRDTGREYDEDNNPVFKARELPTTSKEDRKKKAQRKIGNGLNYIEPN